MGYVITKNIARRELLRTRRLLSDVEYKKRCQALSKRAIDFLEFLRIDSFHTFLPIVRNREPDTWPILHYFHEKKCKILLSKTLFDDHKMEHYIYDDQLNFNSNKLGIPEPINGTKVELDTVNTLLLPLVGFDRYGNRLGYGGGFYDRMLEGCQHKYLKIGLSIATGFDHFGFAEAHDIQLDYCITPGKIERFK